MALKMINFIIKDLFVMTSWSTLSEAFEC